MLLIVRIKDKLFNRKNEVEVESIKGELPLEDINPDNVFVNDELEFSNEQADFGTNAKERIKQIASESSGGTHNVSVTNNLTDSQVTFQIGVIYKNTTNYMIENISVETPFIPTSGGVMFIKSTGTVEGYATITGDYQVISGTNLRTGMYLMLHSDINILLEDL